MDTAYRKFHAAFPNALNEAPDLEKSLRRLADLAESQYRRQFLRETAAAWERTASGDLATLGQVTGIPRQLDFFMTEIDPLLRKKKQKRTWVIISDALRYEVAVELAETLERTTQGQARVTSMQAGFPSITSHGMAALLPHASLKIAHHETALMMVLPSTSTACPHKVPLPGKPCYAHISTPIIRYGWSGAAKLGASQDVAR